MNIETSKALKNDKIRNDDVEYTEKMAEKDKEEMIEFAVCLHDWIATVFEKYDTDHDGHIDRYEAAQFFKDIMHIGPKTAVTDMERESEMFAQYFDSLDFNDDGGVTPEELKAFVIDTISVKELSI